MPPPPGSSALLRPASTSPGVKEPRGKLTARAPLSPLVWFKSGGAAEWLFEPADLTDLQDFLRDLDRSVPVMALGLGSNLIVRDGGVPGVVVRLGKAFAKVTAVDATTLDCGGGASGILVSSTARDAGVAGLEFLRSIPGTVGGFVRMNGGAYGGEVKDILVDCDVVLRSGELRTLAVNELGYTYRHSELPEGALPRPTRRTGADPGRDGPDFVQPRGQPAVAQQDRRIDLQESARCEGLGTRRRGGMPRTRAGRRASQREARQLPDQSGKCDEHGYRKSR